MAARTRTVALEVEIDVDVPDGVAWSRELDEDVERWLAEDVLGGADGRELALRDGARVRIAGHSASWVPDAWPMR